MSPDALLMVSSSGLRRLGGTWLRFLPTLVVLAVLGALPTLTSQASATVVRPQALTMHDLPITRGGRTLHVGYCGNGDLRLPNGAVRTIVVVVHGDGRDACSYAADVALAARRSGSLRKTLVVAPRFLATRDAEAAKPDELYWTESGWKEGARSAARPYPRPWAVSSFAVLDTVMKEATVHARFPAADRLVVVGHSAGGQFVNRYAAGSRLAVTAVGGAPVRFVVANPSSYLYLRAERFVAGRWRRLTAAELGRCPGYDRYKYGLERPNVYVATSSAKEIRRRYAARQVTYLLGEQDTSRGDPTLDTGCAATWQGKDRLHRGLRYVRSLGRALGPGVYVTHRLVLVPGAAHSARAMLTSHAGRLAMLGRKGP